MRILLQDREHMSAPTRVTQRELARIAKVSHTTISLALREHPSIPVETRTRIAELARKHRYQPDPMLAALNAYRLSRTPSGFQGTLAWVTSFSSPSAWRDMIQAEGYFLGAQAQAQKLGYKLEEFWMGEPKLTSRRATQVLHSRGVRGIIVAPLPVAHGNLDLAWERFSAVALGYSLTHPQLHVVMNHQFRNMRHLVQQLHALGHCRIGFAMPATTDERVDHNYVGGYWVTQRTLPARSTRLSPLLAPKFTQDVFCRWARRARPDAVITSAGWAYRVIDWLKAEGLSVPDEVGVAVASTPFGDSTISGIDENVRMVGAMAVDTVVGMIHRNESGVPANPWRILAEGTWSPGKTVERRNGRRVTG
jgi:DNA-binding LacI/PurR family transcriptional regulator